MKSNGIWLSVYLVFGLFFCLSEGWATPEFVLINDPGNASDSTGYGAVGYCYEISTHEVTIAQFDASGAGNGDEDYWNDGVRTVGTNAPAVNITLNEAKKYCNYLTSGNIQNGVYQFNNGTNNDSTGSLSRDNILTNTTYGAWYAITTEDEWYKAAYYTGDISDKWSLYADGSDTMPIHGTTDGWNYYSNGLVNSSPNYVWKSGFGGEEQNGTYDMMGNVYEVMQSGSVGRGGFYYSYETQLSSTYRDTTFTPQNGAKHAGIRVVKIIPNWIAPTVINDTVSAVTDNSAILNGNVVDTGGEVPYVIIYWGVSDGGIVPENWDYYIIKGLQGGNFSESISGLEQNSKYYYRCYAYNSMGGDWADSTGSFSTLIEAIGIVSVELTNGVDFVVRWRGTNGWSYSLQESTNLSVPVWNGVDGATNISGINGIMSATNNGSQYSEQFYRVLGSKL